MLKDEKLEYQEDLEKYLEENEVYEVFETMMKSLIIDQPEDPVPFLLDVLEKPQTKRVFIMGPPGSKRKEHILTLADNFEDFKYEAICVGDLLSKEVSKKSDFGKRINDARKTYYSYVDDDIVIDLVSKQIEQLEKEKKNWIIEGFPRTRKQALSLNKLKVPFIPDRMILLDVNDELTKQRVKENLTSDESNVKIEDDKLTETIDTAVEEYHTHIEGVKDVYKGMISVIDANKNQDIVLQEIARILKLKENNAPRRAPRIVLIGAPGSGKTTQARKLAEKLKVVHIQADSLVKSVIAKGGNEAKELWKAFKEGELIPEETIQNLIKDRISQPDAKMNGFVLDGFPQNSDHMRFLMDECNIRPSHLIFLEINDQKAFDRVENRRFDPETGTFCNINFNAPKDSQVLERLIHTPEDQHDVIEKKLKRHKEFVMDLQTKLEVGELVIINADNSPDTVFMDITSEI